MKTVEILYAKKQVHGEREQYVNQVAIYEFRERTCVSGTRDEMETTNYDTDSCYDQLISTTNAVADRRQWLTSESRCIGSLPAPVVSSHDLLERPQRVIVSQIA